MKHAVIGTGKNLAARAILNEPQVRLYRIDLSMVPNKYIGETEKNLSRLFDAAESSGTILMFDEADALFGRKTEVKDSHDRYVTIEVGYLLQRIEPSQRLAILSTKLRVTLTTRPRRGSGLYSNSRSQKGKTRRNARIRRKKTGV